MGGRAYIFVRFCSHVYASLRNLTVHADGYCRVKAVLQHPAAEHALNVSTEAVERDPRPTTQEIAAQKLRPPKEPNCDSRLESTTRIEG